MSKIKNAHSFMNRCQTGRKNGLQNVLYTKLLSQKLERFKTTLYGFPGAAITNSHTRVAYTHSHNPGGQTSEIKVLSPKALGDNPSWLLPASGGSHSSLAYNFITSISDSIPAWPLLSLFKKGQEIAMKSATCWINPGSSHLDLQLNYIHKDPFPK